MPEDFPRGARFGRYNSLQFRTRDSSKYSAGFTFMHFRFLCVAYIDIKKHLFLILFSDTYIVIKLKKLKELEKFNFI